MNCAIFAVWIAVGIAGASPAPAPAITAAPAMDVAPGYFLVQGSRIVSKPYQNERACQQALKAIKRDMQPGSDTLVCAHRRP